MIAGAFRELLTGRDENPDQAVVRTLVPVSTRSTGDLARNNQVSAMIADLPVGITDPVERLTSMRQQMEESQGLQPGGHRAHSRCSPASPPRRCWRLHSS